MSKASAKIYYEKNKERILRKNREYKQKNKEKIREKKKEYRKRIASERSTSWDKSGSWKKDFSIFEKYENLLIKKYK